MQHGTAGATASRVEEAASRLRAWLTEGEFGPGDRLSEMTIAERLDVSRNTLREAFTVLVLEGLLERRPNRGVRVTVPTPESIMDVYRVRRIVEVAALRDARGGHPAIARMQDAVEAASAAASADDWHDVGTANMAFHAALMEFTDSPRLLRFAGVVTAELRLVFAMVDDPRRLHEPYVADNRRLLGLVEAGRFDDAAELLDRYLAASEREVLRAFTAQGTS